MIYSELKYISIEAADGNLGFLRDALVDDRSWNIRYFVIDTSMWMFGRQRVVIPPGEFEYVVNGNMKSLRTHLSKDEIRQSPELRDNLPLHRQFEKEIHKYYDYAPYWNMPAVGGGWPYFDVPLFPNWRNRYTYPEPWKKVIARHNRRGDIHLRSLNEIVDYSVDAVDVDGFGEVKDFILNLDETSVLDIILSSSKYLPGGDELVCSPLLVSAVSVDDKSLSLSLWKETLLSSPIYDYADYDKQYREMLVEHYTNFDLPEHGPIPYQGVAETRHLSP